MMSFMILPDWAERNTIYNITDNPEYPWHRFRNVRLPLTDYFYNIYVLSNPYDINSESINICLIDFLDALNTVQISLKSSFFIQVPACKIDKKPTIYKVAKIYKSTDIHSQLYIIRCTNNKKYVVGADDEKQNIFESTVDMEIVWSSQGRARNGRTVSLKSIIR